MELEYKDNRSKGRFVVIAGVILALVAGGLAFYTLNQAQQQAGQSGTKKVSLVVAVAAIPARQVIKPADVALRQVPLDDTNANGTVNDPSLVVGRIAAVTILQGQLVTSNMLASTTEGVPFSILEPDETVAPDSEALRAIAITVPDDLALGGMVVAGQTVDVFVTAVVNIADPTGQVHHRPIDQDHLPGRRDPRAHGDLLHDPRPAGGGGGARTPPGDGLGDLQLRAATRRGRSGHGRERPRRDDQPHHREVRPAHPGGGLAGLHAGESPVADARPERGPGSGPQRFPRRVARRVARRVRGAIPGGLDGPVTRRRSGVTDPQPRSAGKRYQRITPRPSKPAGARA